MDYSYTLSDSMSYAFLILVMVSVSSWLKNTDEKFSVAAVLHAFVNKFFCQLCYVKVSEGVFLGVSALMYEEYDSSSPAILRQHNELNSR